MTVKVSFRTGADAQFPAAVVVLAGPDGALSPAAKAADESSGGQLGRAMKAANFTGKKGQAVEIVAPHGLAADRLLLVGIGDPSKADARAFEDVGGAIAAKLLVSTRAAQVDLSGMSGLGTSAMEAAAHLGLGAALRSWRHDRYRTKLKDDEKPKLADLHIVTEADPAAHFAALEQVASGVFLARELVTEPGNIIYPESFVERVRKEVEPLGIKVTVLDVPAMEALGMWSLLSVGQGSARPSRMLAMEWMGGTEGETPLMLIGKGVTFDTGGISLKPAAGMEDMRTDMGGAAAVAGAMRAIAGRKAKANVVGVCGLVENMPSDRATRPGDVVTSMSGITVEIINTDAEGRLVLIDAMTWAQRQWKPDVMIDLATLTGAMVIAVAHEYAGMFTNDDRLAEQLTAAGLAVDDKVWRFPLSEVGGSYDKLIDSPLADMKNVGPREGGSITAAQFLQRVVDDGVKWAHLDVAGAVSRPKDGSLHAKGATGYGVRLLDRFVRDTRER
ncbi:MAG: leucyl aminopeptidase [Thermaurantiacus sp.]